MKKITFLLGLIITLFSITVNADGILDNGKNIYSDHVLMVNLDTDKVVYEKDADTITYPASLTKIMTCILAIENTESLDEIVTIPSGLFDDVYADNGVDMNLKVGEEISVRDLITATMIRSTCDSASALAWYISGSIENFASLMNEKARELGCTSTHFVNAHGLHNPNHYTTARDLYLITTYALQNKEFCDIISQNSCVIQPTNKSDLREYSSTIEIEVPTNPLYYEYVTGIKSGFTDEAGRCLITRATKENESFLLITLGANRDGYYTSNMAFTDAVTLYEYSFAKYDVKEIVSSDTPVAEIAVSKGKKNTVSLYVDEALVALAALSDTPEFSFDVPKKIKAPVKENSVIGKLTVSVNGDTYTRNLVARENVEGDRERSGLRKFNNGSIIATIFDAAAIVIFIIGVVILAFFIISIKKSKKK